MLPTSRLFGPISQKGPNKNWSCRTYLLPNFGRFLTKRAGKGLNFKQIVSLVLYYLIQGKSRKYYYFPLTQTKIVLFKPFLSPNSFKEWKILGDRIFSSAAEFTSGLAEKFCKEFATMVPTSNHSVSKMGNDRPYLYGTVFSILKICLFMLPSYLLVYAS